MFKSDGPERAWAAVRFALLSGSEAALAPDLGGFRAEFQRRVDLAFARRGIDVEELEKMYGGGGR